MIKDERKCCGPNGTPYSLIITAAKRRVSMGSNFI
jgi:hypothetical protein